MGRGCVEPLPLCPRVLRRSLSHLGTQDPERTNHLVGVRKTQIRKLRTKQTPNQALAPVTCSPTFQRRRGWGIPAKGNSLLPNTMTTWTSPGGMQKYWKENYKDR